jgi:hypothetical protein
MSKPINCPHCDSALSVETVAELANESEIELTLKPAPGEMMGARTVGATIDNMDKMFKAIGKEMGAPTETLVRRIVTDADGTIRVTLVICRYDEARRIRTRRAQAGFEGSAKEKAGACNTGPS